MAINPEDVKLYESQRLTDEDDGGGRATGNEIIDGNINNLFPDISRLDRTLGDVALRKAFVGINTDNQDVYLGAHAIIVEPPADPNVSVVMFDAGSESDDRQAAQSRIEAYVVQGGRAQYELLGNQYENQRQIVIVQREEQELPSTGDVYMLRKFDGTEQFVRITETEFDMQTFTYQTGQSFVDFERRRGILGISAPLETTFYGGEPTPVGTTAQDGSGNDKSEVFGTEVADAARYWGVSKSVEEVGIGDVQVKATSIYSSLVPSAISESPIADAPFYRIPPDVRPAAAADITETFKTTYITGTTVLGYLPRPGVRGTVQLTLSGSGYDDDGSGILTRVSGSAPFSELSIDYATGAVEGTRDSGSSSGVLTGSVTFRPGVPYIGKRISHGIKIDLNNRGFTYITASPTDKPRPGTTAISYMALGKWYTLRDSGSGVLEGYGSGSVNFTTGTTVATLDAMPDVGSQVIVEMVMDIADEVEEQSGTVTDATEITITCEQGVDPGSLVVTYTADGADYTLTDVALSGTLAGDGTGTVDYSNGVVTIKPTFTPDSDQLITLDYDLLGASDYVIPSPAVDGGGAVSGTIPGAPLKPGTVSIEFSTQKKVEYNYTNDSSRATSFRRKIYDNGSGSFTGATGTINYTTGAFSVVVESSYATTYMRTSSYYDPSSNSRVYSRESAGFNVEYTIAGSLFISFSLASASASTATESVPYEAVEFNLLDKEQVLLPNSLLFSWAGKKYYDRDGVIYTDFDPATGAGTAVGTVNYGGAVVSLNSWPDNAAPGLTVIAAATTEADILTDRITFRTGAAPLRPQSLIVTVTDADGNVVNEQIDVEGNFDGPSLVGTGNVETGVVDLTFTDGTDPIWVYPETGRYSAVLISSLPLDAELIGLDPVRLPSDGRVPVYREGDVIVLSHTATTDAGTPTAGQAIVLARDHQASIIVEDANGLKLDPAMYIGNKETGTVTFADPLTLETADNTALTAPLNIKDRVEHMSVINDVQISGELSFISPAGHVFPADDTIVSSAKVWGDINSRYYSFFTQKTWSSGAPNWTEDRIGDDTTANYNDIDNPIEIANRGAITERWAIVFTSSTAYNIVGEQLGIIGTGSTSVDLAPNNPNTGFPYFVMRAAGWGGGWAAGNVVRFNTDGCLAPVWLARSVKSGQATVDDDQFVLQIRGDAD